MSVKFKEKYLTFKLFSCPGGKFSDRFLFIVFVFVFIFVIYLFTLKFIIGMELLFRLEDYIEGAVHDSIKSKGKIDKSL